MAALQHGAGRCRGRLVPARHRPGPGRRRCRSAPGCTWSRRMTRTTSPARAPPATCRAFTPRRCRGRNRRLGRLGGPARRWRLRGQPGRGAAGAADRWLRHGPASLLAIRADGALSWPFAEGPAGDAPFLPGDHGLTRPRPPGRRAAGSPAGAVAVPAPPCYTPPAGHPGWPGCPRSAMAARGSRRQKDTPHHGATPSAL